MRLHYLPTLKLTTTAMLVFMLQLAQSSYGQSCEVLLETTMGNIRIALSDQTPIHRDNFVRLVNEHFYDSLLFHRVIKGFMIQAGDPMSRHAEPGVSLGEGDAGYTLEPEFRLPQLFHRRGMVAMAREGDDVNPERRSSGSHFYIVWGKTFSTKGIEDVQQRLDTMTNHTVQLTSEMQHAYRFTGGTPHLDGQYTVFGEVVEGLDVVERIQQVFTDDYDRPVDDVRIIRATYIKGGQHTPEGIGKMTLLKGFQTTGRGQQRAVLQCLKIEDNVSSTARITRLHVWLNGNTATNVSALRVLHTTMPELYADPHPTLLGEAMSVTDGGPVTIELSGVPLPKGDNYVWLTAAVKDDAALGETIDADIGSAEYEVAGKPHSFPFPSRQPGGLKIFASQSIVYAPTSDGCRFYRIPAMTLDRHGNIVVAADRRYDSNADLGNHRIDISVRRSTDGGRTWTPQQVIARGDGSTLSDYGYGDPVLARTSGGRLICVAAAGKLGFWQGMRWAVCCTSDDDGLTWTPPRQLFAHRFRDLANGTVDSLGFYGIFSSSGKGLTTRDGTVMFTTNCLTHADKRSPQCYILATADEGDTWTLGPANAYAGCDESKLEQLNDGHLLLSVRQNGVRGFNTGSSDATLWGEQRTTTQLPGTAVNADLLCYARQADDGDDIMLHTYCRSAGRDHLTLAVSRDEGLTWRDLMTIQEGNAAYSTMVKLPNGDVGILYEDGSYDAGNGYAINFVTIAREQIIK